MSDFDFNNINDLKTEEKRLYEEYKAKLAEIKKVQKGAKGKVGFISALKIHLVLILFCYNLHKNNCLKHL